MRKNLGGFNESKIFLDEHWQSNNLIYFCKLSPSPSIEEEENGIMTNIENPLKIISAQSSLKYWTSNFESHFHFQGQ